MSWEQAGLLVGILSPLVGVPLLMITLYLRAIRDHQTNTKAEITQRIETMEAAIRDLLKSTAEFEREYTTKEEWVRESIFARQRLEKLMELVTRIEAELENGHGVAAEMGRIATVITEMVKGKELSAGRAQ